MKWPAKKDLSHTDGIHTFKYYEGFNDCLEQCHRLNQPAEPASNKPEQENGLEQWNALYKFLESYLPTDNLVLTTPQQIQKWTIRLVNAIEGKFSLQDKCTTFSPKQSNQANEALDKEINLTQEFSAKVWAQEFSKMYPMILKDGEGAMQSEEIMLTWFANAIMAGYDYNTRKVEEAECKKGYEKGFIDAKAIYDKSSKFATPPQKAALEPLDKQEVFEVVRANNNTFVTDTDCRYIAKFICERFGTPQRAVMSVEEILKTIRKCFNQDPYNQHEYIAQAIHTALTSKEKCHGQTLISEKQLTNIILDNGNCSPKYAEDLAKAIYKTI